MVELDARRGTNGSNGHNVGGSQLAHDAEMAWREARGATQLGPFEYVPPLGFREYWYPAVYKREIGTKKPALVKMLGEDVVLFRGKADKVCAMFDWCPHRSARLSQGESLFPGTITCEYHGYTFDGKGECVAGLIDDPKTPVIGKMKGKAYPTAEHGGIVYVWMGETEPVPLEEDLPPEIVDSRNHFYSCKSVWDANWTEPVNQGIDYHAAYLHRKSFNYMGGWTKPWKFKFHSLLHKNLPFFRPRIANYGGIKISYEDEKRVCSNPVRPKFGEDFHPGVNANWPNKRWYMFLGQRGSALSGDAPGTSLLGIPNFAHGVELPSKVRIGSGSEKPAIHMKMRWMVPVTFETTRVWTLTIGRRPKNVLGRMYEYLWYVLWQKPHAIIRVNEWEDLVTFKTDRLRYDLPQKLSTLDTVVIYFRRHLAKRSRDFQRLGGTYGSNHLPTGVVEKQKDAVPAQVGDD